MEQRQQYGIILVVLLLGGVIVALVMTGGSASTEPAAQVIRDAPDNITAGEPFRVDIHVYPEREGRIMIAENISNRVTLINGTTTLNDTVSDNRTISYWGVLPVTDTDRLTFAGTVTLAGQSQQINGSWYAPVDRPRSLITATGELDGETLQITLQKTVYPALGELTITVTAAEPSVADQIEQTLTINDTTTGRGTLETLTARLPSDETTITLTGQVEHASGIYTVDGTRIMPSQEVGTVAP